MDNQHIIFIEEEDQPYSDIVVTEGKYLFLSGLVSENLETRDEAYGSIEFETNRILDNLKVILEAHGSDMDHVVRADVMLAKWADKDAMNGEYVKHFRKNRLPARVCFGDVSIAGECKVEMTFIATKK
ncbi:MAG: RidA family protein [Oscillospiraceae bacterium]|nr:RidA family protein [Oscillospiraceae bacterium]